MAQNSSNKGGKSTDKSSSGKSGGSFKDNPERASEAGRKGGENSHGGRKS